MLTLTITATTTTEAIEQAIPFLDMREHAVEQRDTAAAVIEEQGDQAVLELHEIDGVTVLYSPVFGYAYVNEVPGACDSLLIDNGQADSAEHAAQQWRSRIAELEAQAIGFSSAAACAEHQEWLKGQERDGKLARTIDSPAYVVTPSAAEDDENAIANARLIAAAPELLDELRKALDSLEYVERTFPGMAGCGVRQERISSARAVIAKTVERGRCPLCRYQHGHAIGCDNNPVDQALARAATANGQGSAA